MLKISQDHERFRKIVEGKIKQNLGKYIANDVLVDKRGEDKVRITIPRIEIPRFTYGHKALGGIGQGDGEEGFPFDPFEDADGSSGSDEPGEQTLDVEMSLDQLTTLLMEKLELPYLEPKPGGKIEGGEKLQASTLRRVGVIKNNRRTLLSALKRSIMDGSYQSQRPVVVPTKEDMWYTVRKTKPDNITNAVLFPIMDISLSMGEEQRRLCRLNYHWIHTLLRRQYPHIEERFIVHDASAQEVDKKTFFRVKSSGGTLISSAYELLLRMVEQEYSPEHWNIYPIQYSDGENEKEDNRRCRLLLGERILPISQTFCYAQCKADPLFSSGEGPYISYLNFAFKKDETYQRLKHKVRLTLLRDDEEILRSLQVFFRPGKR